MTSTLDVPPPTLSTIDGHPVTWQPWTPIGPVYVCPGGVARCDRCGAHESLIAHGTVAYDLPGHPVKRAVAFHCPGCGARAVYDTGTTGLAFRLVGEGEQLDLLASVP